MCVIFVASEARPTAEELVLAEESNPHGIGVAWMDSTRGFVRWTKGLSLTQAKNMAQNLPLPYAMHFRFATSGGQSDELCHPFPVEYNVRLDKYGKTDRSVLMHNGHWSDWDKFVGRKAKKRGRWSDSRGIAWMLARAKDKADLLNTIPGKFAMITPTEIHTYGGFPEVRKGLTASNLFWQHSHTFYDHVRGYKRPYYLDYEDDDFDLNLATSYGSQAEAQLAAERWARGDDSPARDIGFLHQEGTLVELFPEDSEGEGELGLLEDKAAQNAALDLAHVDEKTGQVKLPSFNTWMAERKALAQGR